MAGRCLFLQSIAEQTKTLQQSRLPQIGGYDSIAKCVDELIVAKTAGNRTARYVRSLKHYLIQFSQGREHLPISDFTFQNVESWVEKYPCADTRRTWISRLSALFAFCVRRGYILANPCDRVESVICDRKPPAIVTPGQSRELLAAAPVVMRPYLILGMFAGIRPEELTRLDWSHINLETATVNIDFPKVRGQRRIVPLDALAVEFLRRHPLQRGAVTPSNSTVDRWRKRARRQLGFARWPQDLFRHTAASYLLAKHEDAAKVAMRLGNSVKILMSHYIVPVSKTDCDFFWAECPTMSDKVRLAGGATASKIKTDGKTLRPNELAPDAGNENGVRTTGAQATAQRELHCAGIHPPIAG